MKRMTVVLVILVIGYLFSTAAVILAETKAYIPDFGDDKVTQLLTADDTASKVAFLGGPYGAAVSPQGDYLVVTRSSADSVTIVATDEFSDTSAQFECTVGEEPRGVAIDSTTTYAYAANYSGGTVSEISISSATVTDTFDVGNGPWGVTVFYDEDEEHRIVYVSNNLDDSISVITDGDVETIANVGGGPVGVALSPDGAYLYVALFDDNTVAIIQTSDNTVVKRITTGTAPYAVAVGSDGAYLYVTNSGSESVTVINTEEQTVYDTITVGQEPRGVACPKNGNTAYVVCGADKSVSRINIDAQPADVEPSIADLVGDPYALGNFIGGAAPDEPSSLSAQALSNSQIDLDWADNADDELGFKIERRKVDNADDEDEDADDDDDADAFAQIATVDADVTSYTDNGLSSDVTYQYRVRSYNETTDSDYSATAEATTEHTRFSWCFIGTMLE